jgi:hypothetical protein
MEAIRWIWWREVIRHLLLVSCGSQLETLVATSDKSPTTDDISSNSRARSRIIYASPSYRIKLFNFREFASRNR